MRKNAILIALGLLIVLGFVGNAAHFYKLGFVEQLANILYDYRLQWTMPRTIDERIVIIDIDEKSLREEGRWPWSRNRLAALLDKLFDQNGVRVLGLDMVLAEADQSSGLRVLQELGAGALKADAKFHAALTELRPDLEYDATLARAMRQRPVVLGYYLTQQEEAHTSGSLPTPALPAAALPGSVATHVTAWNGYGANLPEFQQVAASAGHFNPLIDDDGAVRRIPMLVQYGDAYYESLSLAVVRTLLQQPPIKVGLQAGYEDQGAGLEALEIGNAQTNLKIPLDAEAAALVPFRGAQGSFHYVSATDILHDRVDASLLNNKIVLLGTTAPGLLDMRHVPVAEVFPGVEVHANMIAGMLDQNIKHQPAYMLGAEVIWLLVVGIALSFLLPVLRPALSMLSVAALFAISFGMSVVLWQYANLVMPVANSLVMIAGLFVLNVSYGYFFVSRNKRYILDRFKSYVPSELVDEMNRHPEQMVSMAGESRNMTMLFSDVRGFTHISEQLDPKVLSQLMNEFLTPLSRIIYQHQGKVDKYMGDCIMAFWGAPEPLANHARCGLQAAMEMQQAMRQLRADFKAKGWPEIYVGVGINSGRVSVGNMGSEVRVAYTVMGDAVNLASRLEGLTKQYGVDILVGENTRNAVPEFLYRELDHVQVVGKDVPVALYEPLGLADELGTQVQAEVALFHEMRRCYRQCDWDGAESHLLELSRRSLHDKLYQIYLERVRHFRREPPPVGWDGVYVHQSK